MQYRGFTVLFNYHALDTPYLLQVSVHGLCTVIGAMSDGPFREMPGVNFIHRAVLVCDNFAQHETLLCHLPQDRIKHVTLCTICQL